MNDLQKLIDKVIDKAVMGCDTYKHNGSTWLLFTDDKKWVIELTKEGTLWYNYYFFQKLFKVIALDVVENQHYITKWVEDTVINGVKSIKGEYYKEIQKVEYTIQNGVKKTRRNGDSMDTEAEDAIQNGVKETHRDAERHTKTVEDAIQNGVKETHSGCNLLINDSIEDTIQNGVKHTSNRRLVVSKDIEDTIQNGVKRTLQKNINRIGQVEDTIQNGVKHTQKQIFNLSDEVEDTIQNGVKHTRKLQFVSPSRVEHTIQNGVKHTIDTTHHKNKYVEDTIQNGVKVTYSDKIPHEYDWSNQFTEEIDDIIQNGVKHTEKSLQIDGSCVIEDVIKEGVIEHGIKETKSEVATREWKAGEVINGGVKKTTPGGYLGSVEMKGKMVHQFEHSKQDDNVEDVIKSGIKATTTNLPLSQDDGQIAEIEDVIKNGIKKTEAAALFDEESKMDTVISNGIKETIPVVPGDILDTIDFMSYNNTTNVQHLISDVIEKGIKETHDDVMPHTGRVETLYHQG
jgi:predicted peroxiredoxin